MKNHIDISIIQELYEKPLHHEFSESEYNLILKYLKRNRNNYVIKYAFYRKPSKMGKQIAVILDTLANSPRRSAAENAYEVIAIRNITDRELEDQARLFGSNNRRYCTWYYSVVEKAIEDDKKCKIETPEIFVKECRKRGYFGNYQLKIAFD